MTRLRSVAMLVLVAPLAFTVGCAQGIGQRCQVQTDCSSGLLCVIPAGGTPQTGGTCEAGNDGGIFDMATFDASVGDLSGTD